MTAIDAVRTPLTAGVEVISTATLTPSVTLIDAETVTGAVDVIRPPGEMAAAVASAMIYTAAASVALAEAICWLAAASVARNDV